ncbi:dual specificity protein phosphatase 19 isoform X1 [Ambystoma mexicanum]|uniref:dual specificity protein phosphatase 19 isoform X1 n=1 Tax=Ambystoma mexicanum TaxID=8296 RepID=UPI0037E959C0
MHSLTHEIEGFSKTNLRKQCTRVTTVTGRRMVESWRDSLLHVEEDSGPDQEDVCGYVQDLSLDLQIGTVRPWLLLGSQDAAQDLDTLKKYKVSHILNVAWGVANAFPDDFICKSIPILDLPETNITSYFLECFDFIQQAKIEGGVVLVHCNAGVSRSAAIVIGFLMHAEGLNFARAFSTVKNARPSVCPNSGFMEQLHKYQRCKNRQSDCIKTDTVETNNPNDTE